MGMFDKANAKGRRQPEDPKPTGAARVHTLTPREEEALWRSEMLGELRALRQTSTSAAAREVAGGLVNGVLDVSTFVFPTEGVIVLDWRVACGSIQVANPSTSATVTVQAGSSSDATVPTSGRGVQVVPASSWLGIPIGQRSVTLYGTAGQTVSVQAFTGLQALGVAQ